jgi:hypothetical protein
MGPARAREPRRQPPPLRQIKEPDWRQYTLRQGRDGAAFRGGDIMADTNKIQITQHSSLGAAWFAGWLFTIGYLQLSFWSGVLGIIVWPYYLGAHFVPH